MLLGDGESKISKSKIEGGIRDKSRVKEMRIREKRVLKGDIS